MASSFSWQCDSSGHRRRATPGAFSLLRSLTCHCSWAPWCSLKYENGNGDCNSTNSAAEAGDSLEDYSHSHSVRDRWPALLVTTGAGQRSLGQAAPFLWHGAELRACEPGRAAVWFPTAVW